MRVPEPREGLSAKTKVALALWCAVGALLYIAIYFPHFGAEPSEASSMLTPNVMPTLTCQNNWPSCADNTDLVEHSLAWGRAQTACKAAANNAAKYGEPKWPWFAFGTYQGGKSYITTGRAIVVEKEAQFQNGFGAWANVQVYCFYDLRKQQVVDMNIVER